MTGWTPERMQMLLRLAEEGLATKGDMLAALRAVIAERDSAVAEAARLRCQGGER